MADGKYGIEVTAYASKFAQEFARAASVATGSANKVIGAARGIQSAFAAVGVGLSLAGLTAFVKGSIDAADKLNDLSKATGVVATTLGGIGFAAEQAGGDLDGAAKAFGKLNLFIAQALGGSKEAIAAFQRVGISVKDLRTQSNEQIFGRLADEFASYEDGANKAASANQFFGKSYQSILPLLDEGSESLQKNVGYYKQYSGVTDDLIRASDEFNDTLTKLSLLNKSFGAYLSAALLPSLQKLADYLLAAKTNGDGFKTTAEGVAEALKVLAKFAVAVGFTFKDFGSTLGAVFAQFAAIGRGDFAAVGRIGDDLNARLADSKKQLLELRKIMNDPSLAVGGAYDPRLDLSAPKAKRKAPDVAAGGSSAKQVDEYAKALERVNKELAVANAEYRSLFSGEVLTKAQKDLAALQSSDEWKKLTGPQQEFLAGVYKQVDALERQTEAFKKSQEEAENQGKVLADLAEKAQQAKERFNDALGDYATDNSSLEREIALIGQDDVARQKLAATIEYERLVKQALAVDDAAGLAILEAQYQKRIDLIDALAAKVRQFNNAEQIKGIFSDAFADEFAQVIDGTKSISDAFKDMERSIVQSISRIAAQNIADAIFGKSGVSGGGWLESIIGVLGKAFGGSFAAGGAPPVGRVSLVGEKGPELFVPKQAGSIVPAGKFGMGNVISINVNVPAGTSRATADQVALSTGAAVRRAVARIG